MFLATSIANMAIIRQDKNPIHCVGFLFLNGDNIGAKINLYEI